METTIGSICTVFGEFLDLIVIGAVSLFNEIDNLASIKKKKKKRGKCINISCTTCVLWMDHVEFCNAYQNLLHVLEKVEGEERR